MKAQKDKLFLAWASLLDLGIEATLSSLKKRRTPKGALEELKKTLSRQSEEHWQVLYKTLKRLK